MSAVPVMRICPKCQWRGPDDNCVHPKHWLLDKLCPECYEVTEVIEVFPARIQRIRHIKGWRLQDVSHALNGLPAVYVGRPTIWGNPFSIRESLYKNHWSVVFEGKSISAEFATRHDAQIEAVRLFEKWFSVEIAEMGTELHDFRNKYGWDGFTLACAVNILRGKNLSCFCCLDEVCHADVLLKAANNV